MEEQKSSGGSFWQSMPGILTGLATTLAAVGGLVAALHSAGVIGNKTESEQAQVESADTQPADPDYAASMADTEQPTESLPADAATDVAENAAPDSLNSGEPVADDASYAEQPSDNSAEAPVEDTAMTSP